MGRRGYATIAAIAIAAAGAQLAFLLVTADRSWTTMLPLLVGATVVAGMLLGALLRRTPRSSSPA
jgi:hypothetical protein